MMNSIFLTLIFIVNVFTQIESIKFKHFNAKDGLSQNSVYSILQDSEGFLWVGTKDGLNKYDGFSFKHYQQIPNDSFSLSDNYIRSLYEDDENQLWIGTEYGGLNVFDRNKDIIRPIQVKSQEFKDLKTVYSIAGDIDGNLWLATRFYGLLKYNTRLKTFQFPEFYNGINSPYPFNTALTLYVEKGHILWVGLDKFKGLGRIDLSTNRYEVFKIEETERGTYDLNSIYSIYRSSAGSLWLATVDGLVKFNEFSKSFEHYPLNNGWKNTFIKGITEDNSGNLWIATNRFGLCKFNPKTKIYHFYVSSIVDRHLSEQSDIEVIYKDDNGLIWFGLNGDGLSYFNPNPKFIHYIYNESEKNILSAPSVRSIHVDQKNALWIGDYGGLNYYNRNTGEIKYYKYDKNDPTSIQNNNIYSLGIDKDNQLFVGTEGDGLFKFNDQKESFSSVYSLGEDYKFVYEMYIDSRNTIWVGTFGGLVKIMHQNDRLVSTVIQSLNSKSIFAIYENTLGHLWIGTEKDGIYILNTNGDILENYTFDQNNKKSLSSNKIKSIYKDHSGTIWIGTNGGGLNKYDKNTHTFTAYTNADGLPNNVVYGILEDSEHNLWMSTNIGLSKFNPEANTFRNYTDEDGLQSNEFNTAAYFQSDDGEMFFGGINGLNAFYPKNVINNKIIPKVQITKFKLFNEPVDVNSKISGRILLKKDISVTDSLILNYKENIISFEFSALSFVAAEKNKYAYKLINFKDDWVSTDANNRTATFTNLEPGEYVFVVKGSNEDEVWNEIGKSITIIIIPPVWATWWAYSFYIILFIFIIYLIIHLRTISTQNINIKLRNMVDERTEELEASTQELKEQYDLVSGVINSLTDPFYVVNVDNNETILENQAAKASSKIVTQSNFSKLIETIITEVKANGEPTRKEFTYTDDHGVLTDVEFSAFPLSNIKGAISQIIYYWKNISERKSDERSRSFDLQMKSNALKSKIVSTQNLNEQLLKLSTAIESEALKMKIPESTYEKVIKRIKKLITAEQDDFDYWFGEENKDFFERLFRINNTLTKRQLRICSLLRLNLNTKEIAELFQLTPKTVEVYRSQIRDKLNLSKDENLNKFLSEV